MNVVTAGNSVKHSKPTGKGHYNNTAFKDRLNKTHFYTEKVRVHGCVSVPVDEVRDCVRARFADTHSK